MSEFREFPKIARLYRECIISEKIDGTNAQIIIDEDGAMAFGSRTRLITPQDDNYGFASWCEDNREDLLSLGPGHHFGEWWGSGINRGYGLPKGEKRFSLFNVDRWRDVRPKCCGIVPVLYQGLFSTAEVDETLDMLRVKGSLASPGFMKPEGIVVWHFAANMAFKVTLDRDSEWKGKAVG